MKLKGFKIGNFVVLLGVIALMVSGKLTCDYGILIIIYLMEIRL